MVRVGSTYFHSGGQVKRIKKIILHNDFIMLEDQPINDIALLHMRNKFSFSETIKPVALPKPFTDWQVGVSCIVSGWGADDPVDEHPTKHLMATVAKVLPQFQCTNIYMNLNYTIDDSMCCALGTSKNSQSSDSCQGMALKFIF